MRPLLTNLESCRFADDIYRTRYTGRTERHIAAERQHALACSVTLDAPGERRDSSVPRRDAAQKLDDSVERMWRVYADEIGIPGAVSAASKDALPKQDHMPLPARRPARRSVRSSARIVAGVATMAVSVTALVVVWQRAPFSSATSERPPAILASPAPTGERIVVQRTMIADAQIDE